MTTCHSFFATTAKGLEPVLAEELSILNLRDVRPGRGGVEFQGTLKDGYKACLWSRIASRVLLELKRFDAENDKQLYRGVLSVDWSEHLDVSQSLSIDFASPDKAFNHSLFAAQRVKDAIVDQFRETCGNRPSIDRHQPDIRINAYIHRAKARIALDLSGEALHKRGYRTAHVEAPIKETLAAALLYKSGWPDLAKDRKTLLDPMCGSGTFCIEAAMMAAQIAPGLKRKQFGFQQWKLHDNESWSGLRREAEAQIDLDAIPDIYGYDQDPKAIISAQMNVQNVGLEDKIHIKQQPVDQLTNEFSSTGLIITNPPYGERLSEQREIIQLLSNFSMVLKENFQGWTASIITADRETGFVMGIRSRKPFNFYNGALSCYLLRLQIEQANFLRTETERLSSQALSESALGLANRLKKNLRTVGKWAKQNAIHCYRLYDADIPEYALAIDIYQDKDDNRWVHVQEYQAPKTIDTKIAAKHLQESKAVLVQTLDLDIDHIVYKVRQRQRGNDQYQSMNNQQQWITVTEDESKYRVNLTDYLDTGLFPDHRITRNKIRDIAKDKALLNLFAYTGSFTIKAIHGGARETISIDMSRTYQEWTKDNMVLNGIKPGKKHDLIQTDCLAWLDQQSNKPERFFDIIILDPPTFSNSKRMQQSLDIQKDHSRLIRQCAKLLSSDGVIFFSCNFRKFKMDEELMNKFSCIDIGKETLPRDYQRKPGYRHTWEIRLKK